MKKHPVVLLVEDDPDEREIYSRYLSHHGYGVLHASNGEEALAVVNRYMPDLVLLDLDIPMLHGIGVCSALRDDPSTSRIPVVVLTGHAEYKDFALARGCSAYLLKPQPPEAVLEEIVRHIGLPPGR